MAILSAAMILGGCATVHSVSPAASGVDLEAINGRLAGHVVLVRLRDGKEFLARDVRISEDSVSLRRERFRGADHDWPAREREEIPVFRVRSVQVNRKGTGALQGSLVGLGVGAAAGASAGGLLHGPDDDLSTFMGAVVFGVLGGGLGFLVGASVGSPEVYEVSDSTVVGHPPDGGWE